MPQKCPIHQWEGGKGHQSKPVIKNTYQAFFPTSLTDRADIHSQCLLMQRCLGNGNSEHLTKHKSFSSRMDFCAEQTADVS